ncbi:hypothetical protein DB346_02235 [Verrucomicrobia bacterium LW23]|nr:hypothetical protein DB346_02235 [Verrucomicrobia bacterium LW23]
MEKKGKRLDHEFRAEYSYVGESELSGNTRDRGGKLSEHAVSVGYSVKAPINERFAVEVGVEYDRLDFERPSGSFLPQNLQESSFHVMAQYALTEKWGLFFRGGPSLSLVNGAGVTSDNISFKGMAGAGWRPNDKLMVMAGLLVSQDVSQSFPVLPIASVEWKFAENWELNLGMPKTSLSWQVMPNLRLALIEAQMKGGSYQTAKDYGTKVGLPELNSRNLNYTEIRVGSRIDYALTENIEINLGVGAAVYRKFEFEDLDGSSPNVDPAPYVQAGVKITF